MGPSMSARPSELSVSLRSQNGWAVLDRSDLTWFTAAGQRFAAANADVATIGQYLIDRFHAEVESIIGPVLDDWSFAVRNVRGSMTVISNHSSATAWDLNATQHPRGVKNTFTPRQARAFRRIAKSITDDSGDVIIRLGMDYAGTVDDMHAEINAGARSVHQAAEKIRALQEDDVTPADRKAIVDDLWSRILTEPVVRNLPTKKGDPEGRKFTIPEALARIDLKADLTLAAERTENP